MLIYEGDPSLDPLESPYIKLYSLGTPNGQKITILLELLQLNYHYRKIDIQSMEQKSNWFLKLNPNGRIPVLSDVNKSGHRTTIFETGAILTYLVEKYDTKRRFSHDISSPLYWDQLNWLMFQVSDHSPYQGQLSLFQNLLKNSNLATSGNSGDGSSIEKELQIAINWYLSETIRVYKIYERRLKSNNGWFVGDGLNVVDISIFPWVKRAQLVKLIQFDQFPQLKKWIDKLEMIQQVRTGLSIV